MSDFDSPESVERRRVCAEQGHDPVEQDTGPLMGGVLLVCRRCGKFAAKFPSDAPKTGGRT